MRDWQLAALHNVLNVSVWSFVHYQTREHDILKTGETILMLTGISGPQGKGTKRSTLTRLKIDLEAYIGIIVDPLPLDLFFEVPSVRLLCVCIRTTNWILAALSEAG